MRIVCGIGIAAWMALICVVATGCCCKVKTIRTVAEAPQSTSVESSRAAADEKERIRVVPPPAFRRIRLVREGSSSTFRIQKVEVRNAPSVPPMGANSVHDISDWPSGRANVITVSDLFGTGEEYEAIFNACDSAGAHWEQARSIAVEVTYVGGATAFRQVYAGGSNSGEELTVLVGAGTAKLRLAHGSDTSYCAKGLMKSP